MTPNKLLGAVALTAGLVLSGTASAGTTTFNTAGQNIVLNYDYVIDGATIAGKITYTLVSITSTQAVFGIVAQNNTTLAQPGNNRLVSFGIDIIAPTLTGVSDT